MTFQLQLVNLNDENNTQVYIQIDNTNNQQLQHLMEQQVTEGVDQEEAETIELDSSATPTGPTQPRIVRATRLEIKEVCMEFKWPRCVRVEFQVENLRHIWKILKTFW